MGLSFHYQGSIANPDMLPELIEEIVDIASANKWQYDVYEREFPASSFGKPDYDNNIYGISFTPPNCETISICFLSNGRMSNKPLLLFYGKTEEQQESKYLYMISVKTQFAGAEVHKLIIQLFRYLNKKYLTDLIFMDEGSYWETNDEELLNVNFTRNANLINSFASALECIPKLPEESIEAYFERMLKFIKDSKKI